MIARTLRCMCTDTHAHANARTTHTHERARVCIHNTRAHAATIHIALLQTMHSHCSPATAHCTWLLSLHASFLRRRDVAEQLYYSNAPGDFCRVVLQLLHGLPHTAVSMSTRGRWSAGPTQGGTQPNWRVSESRRAWCALFLSVDGAELLSAHRRLTSTPTASPPRTSSTFCRGHRHALSLSLSLPLCTFPSHS